MCKIKTIVTFKISISSEQNSIPPVTENESELGGKINDWFSLE